MGSEGGTNNVFYPNDGTNLTPTGAIRLNGQDYVQLAGATDNTSIKNRDPSMFQYDPTYGLITPSSNVMSGSDPFSDIAPWAMLGIAGAGAASSLLGGAGDLAGASGASNPNYFGMLASNAGTTDVPIGEELGGIGEAAGAAVAPGGAMDEGIGLQDMVGLSPHSASGILGALTSGYPGALSSIPGSLLSSAMSNPLQAIGILQTGAGLLHNAGLLGGGHSTATSSPGKSSGGSGVGALNIHRPQFTPNPYTLAQLRQYGGGGL